MENDTGGHRNNVTAVRLGGSLLAVVALAWGCGGSIASFPDGGGDDGSMSSSGSSSGIVSSSSGASSGSSTGSSTGSSGGGSCGIPGNCISDTQCQQLCPPVPNGTLCCDQPSGACYATQNDICPLPVDAGCPTSNPICPVQDSGNFPPNPDTGIPGCDGCIECMCGGSWCACAGDSGVDSSGSVTGCLGYVNCIIACVNGDPEAGIPPQDGGVQECASLCGPSYTQQQAQEGSALLSCLVGNCSTASTCGG